jgi:cobalt-precorrin 5A hydrolase/precorrin-3B C17-methyltransferase
MRPADEDRPVSTWPFRIAILALTRDGMVLARRLAADLPGAVCHDITGPGAVPRIAACFADGQAVIGLCAAGILIRAVAPLLADKRVEPPVLSVAEDGSAVVPLLGGHHGGNALANHVAQSLGIAPAVTTAGDLRLGVALDEPPRGWRLADPTRAKSAAARLLAGASARVTGYAPWLAGLPAQGVGTVEIRISPKIASPSDTALVYHPSVLALGVGCERGCAPEELIGLAETVLRDSALATVSLTCIVSIDIKSDEPAVHALAAHFGVPARFFPAARLAEETPRLATPSEVVFRETGCWGVAEGAALAAAGSEAVLIQPKRQSARATAAIAKAPRPFDGRAVGTPRGRLTVVGIGPGAADWRTPEAVAALSSARHLVGYGLYLDLLGPLAAGKTRHESGLGDEIWRARCALDLAAGGAAVALVSSGDAGIYGLAALVFELLDREDRPDWRRIDLTVAPGISALQAAAARAGAPLGHDFCAISLSDLMTPWPKIEARLKAAATADFVVALYNPRSPRRSHQLDLAKAIFLAHRPPETPVLLARNLGRTGESLTQVTLAEFEPAKVDMLTLVVIGASSTKAVAGTRWVYTPRGYGDKAPA